jgi:hypothetical protein
MSSQWKRDAVLIGEFLVARALSEIPGKVTLSAVAL